MRTMILAFVSYFLLAACGRDPALNLSVKDSIPVKKISDTIISYETKNIFIIVMDGARYCETWGDSTKQYIPYLNQISKQGVVGVSFYANGHTNTTVGHTAITTGYYQLINNGGSELPEKPSLFQLYRHKYNKPATDCWVFASKDKLEVLGDCKDVNWKGKYKPKTDCGINGNGTGYREDSVTCTHALDTIKKYHPHLVLVNFKQPDVAGHDNHWKEYLKQIKQVDAYIYKLWQYIQADTVYAGKTTVFITNDHGRHLNNVADGFVSHGDNCEGCKHIMLFATGPDFKVNYTEPEKYSLVDIFATSCKFLGLSDVKSEGKVMEKLIK